MRGIAGRRAIAASYAIPAVEPADEGWYWCVVTDEAQSPHECPHTQVVVFPEGSLPAATIPGLLPTAALFLCAAAVLTPRKRWRISRRE